MDGLIAVQARIGQIQARFTPPAATSASWASAAAAAGLTGTGSATSTATLSATGTGAEVVGAATKYLGVPYKWGGTDPATGLDCSGFTQRVYADLGISIPRTSSQQATAGRPVASLAEAQPGDLVFFDNSSSRTGIDHVGLYIGGGKMIAAPQEGDVVKVQDVGNPTLIRRVLPEGTSTAAVSAATGGGLAGVPYADLFTQAGAKHGISPALLAAVAKVESGFNSSAVSSAGATGLMQFMPATATGLGVNAADPASAIDGAARYLSSLTAQFGSTELALAAYNAGPGAVSRAGGIPANGQTQSYVQKVTRAAEAYS
ncbi:transglycosylase SLT domain-containing protein [uncultured Modestobacter sp.]|uniref:transglycosylase SLT domain-containing protein n=1 Tax=uncultured Modestobacter sp. TaxID=380048 RepID=UPI00263315AE|nr:transglycosylase SLT domain-containing protein [uncultured Modestobacter sp.]